MDPGECKHVALGLLFLRYVGEGFERKRAEFAADPLADEDDAGEYLADNVFRVPEAARWSRLAANAKDPKIGVMVDDAMRAIEADDERLKDALPKVFGRASLDRSIVTGLIELSSNIRFEGDDSDFDLIGRIYEYFIGEFASNEGKRGRFFKGIIPFQKLGALDAHPHFGEAHADLSRRVHFPVEPPRDGE